MRIADNWEKPRSRNEHLTQAEIARIRVAFNCGLHPRDIARELQCSSRVAMKYYAQFRGKPHQVTKRPRTKYREIIPAPAPKPVPHSRFYKSNFEL